MIYSTTLDEAAIKSFDTLLTEHYRFTQDREFLEKRAYRGNVEVNLVWSGGQLQSATLCPGSDGELTIRSGDKQLLLKGTAGQPVKINSYLKVVQ